MVRTMIAVFSKIKNRLRQKKRSGSLFFSLFLPMIVVLILGLILLYFFIPLLVEKNIVDDSINSAEQVLNVERLSIQIFMMLSFMIFVLLLVSSWSFKKKIVGPLASATDIANLISEGDLVTHDTKLSSDEVGRLRKTLRMMKIRLAVVINSIRSGAHGVSEAAEQVSQGNTNLSQRTQEQASSLEEIASTMEEMTETVNHNAENASKAKDLAIDANESAKKSLIVVSTSIGAMAKIEKSSKEIADIIRVIENIAFQTNLLALNAAVEAARAGEQGRGFAVVASEVRELAGRSAKAAKEIKELIEDSVDKTEDGSELIEETAVALSEINGSVENVAELITEIAAASKEQSEGIAQVNKALMQMDEMTQSNASLVEEAAAASEAMGAQAEELTSLVSYFKLKDSITGVVERVEDNTKEVHELEKPPAQTALPKQPQQSSESGDEGEWKDF
jgi:methyl-accepting chemotaxis protein